MIWILTLLKTLLRCGLSFNTVWGHLFLGGHFRPFNHNIYENPNNGNAIAQGTRAFITDVLTMSAPLMEGDIYQCTAHSAFPPLGTLDYCVCVYWSQCMLYWWKACIYLCSVYSELAITIGSRRTRLSSAFVSANLWKQQFILQCSPSFPDYDLFHPSFSMPSL